MKGDEKLEGLITWWVMIRKLIGVARNVIVLLKSTMTYWKTGLLSVDTNLGEVSINQDYFKETLYHLCFSLYHWSL